MNDLDLFGGDAGPALSTLAVEINAEHEAAENHARKAIEHARAAGDKLLLAKAGVAHGQWLPWLSANCPRLAERTAQAYMKLARNWATLQRKSATVADLTINDALKLLTGPDSDVDPLESWLSALVPDSRFPLGSIGWMMDKPPAVVYLDAIGWQHSAIAERLSLSATTVAAILDPQPFDRPDLLRHELHSALNDLAPVVDRAQREYRWHVAAQLSEQRGFWCKAVSGIARKFGRNDLAERFAGMEQVYFRESERARAKIPEWRDTGGEPDDSDLLLMGAFCAAMCDAARAFTGEPPEYPEQSIATFIATLWRRYFEQAQAWKAAIANGLNPVDAANALEPTFGLSA
jgi:hypothetical protein